MSDEIARCQNGLKEEKVLFHGSVLDLMKITKQTKPEPHGKVSSLAFILFHRQNRYLQISKHGFSTTGVNQVNW